MSKRYYTPSIKELVIDQYYEYKLDKDDSEWFSSVIREEDYFFSTKGAEITWFGKLKLLLEEKLIRIKLLDAEDFITLGFKKHHTSIKGTEFYESRLASNEVLMAIYSPTSHSIVISYTSPEQSDKILFEGKLYNILQLQHVLDYIQVYYGDAK